MASGHLPEDAGIRPDFLERHTIDSTLLPSPLNGENLREGRERREIERREREESQMRERERRESEAREREERQARVREAREIEKQERTERNNEEQRIRRIQGERTPIQESFNLQCQHYQRLCSVSFPCCGVFYPCHRCHNESDACEIDDMKAEQATHVKCASCGHEDEIKLACPICHHTTIL